MNKRENRNELKIVKTLKKKETLLLPVKIEVNEKSRQNAENKQTFGLTVKIEIIEKSRQNTENEQT